MILLQALRGRVTQLVNSNQHKDNCTIHTLTSQSGSAHPAPFINSFPAFIVLQRSAMRPSLRNKKWGTLRKDEVEQRVFAEPGATSPICSHACVKGVRESSPLTSQLWVKAESIWAQGWGWGQPCSHPSTAQPLPTLHTQPLTPQPLLWTSSSGSSAGRGPGSQ